MENNNGMPCLSKNLVGNLMMAGGGALVLYGATRRSVLGSIGFLAAGGFLLASGMKTRMAAGQACLSLEGFGSRIHHEVKEHWDYERPVPADEMSRLDEEGLESFPASDAPSHSASFT